MDDDSNETANFLNSIKKPAPALHFANSTAGDNGANDDDGDDNSIAVLPVISPPVNDAETWSGKDTNWCVKFKWT